MIRTDLPRSQRGATLVVGLIMLVLITLMVTTAFMLSGTNLRSVGNMQFRNEAVAAANAAIEEVLSSLLTGGSLISPPSQDISVDINNDDKPDYLVAINTPTCVRVSEVGGGGSPPGSGSSVTLGLPPGAPPAFNSLWDIDANVTDADTGASVRIRQGVRVVLTQVQKDAVCP